MKILLTARHPGSAKAVEQVYSELQKKHKLSLYASDKAAEYLSKKIPTKLFSIDNGLTNAQKDDEELLARLEDTIDLILETEKPDKIVTGTSSIGIGIDEVITVMSKVNRRIPVLTVQDFWGTLTQHPSKIKADAYAVIDKEAVRIMKQNFDIETCFITGNPAFDRFKDYNLKRKRSKIRKDLDLHPDQKLIVFLGGVSTQAIESPQTFHALTASLEKLEVNTLDAPKLILRMHPRETSPELYLSALERSHIEIIDSSKLTTEQVMSAADIVTSTYSTGLLEFLYATVDALNSNPSFITYAGIPVYLLMEGLGKKALWEEKQMSTLPPITLGAALNAENENELTSVIHGALYYFSLKQYVLNNAQKCYSPGKATKNIIDIIEML